DNFMKAAQKAEDYELVNPYTNKVVGKLNTGKVLDKIVEMAWRNGEPGLIFLDRINRDNSVPHLGKIESTNPCGEQPLLPFESCNLGSINLSKMVEKNQVNWDKLKKTVHVAVHFLDNVINVNKYPLPEIEKNTKANRKIGLGVMGFADMLIKLGIPYNSQKGLGTAENTMNFIQKESRKASEGLAKTRGVFPNYKGSIYGKEGVKLRNATTTTIAPTGSISMIANCSSGVEPLFSLVYYKEVLSGEKLFYINEEFEKRAKEGGFYSKKLVKRIARNRGSCQGISEVPREIQRNFVTNFDIKAGNHIKMQATFQKYTDNAVSKTINFPNEATVEDIKKAYLFAYKSGCKGITIYRDRSREKQVINVSESKGEGKVRLSPRPRAKVTYGMTLEIKTGCGDLYVTINEDEEGKPFEVFAQLGKAGGCSASQTEAIGRLASLALRSGIPWKLVVKQLKGISCHRPYGFGENKVLSCADAIAKAIELYQNLKKSSEKPLQLTKDLKKMRKSEAEGESSRDTSGYSGRWIGACPECGSSAIEHEGGCYICKSCGYTECE
ncbi:MAG: adenosylcobalamin-dependent ribonucleoside-diphosphate reductase, partial [Candidatus Aerophobetes bacterium]|nr:adenosylcobalamin-dependent ribonucleoside-diphosphate reductase [Candidatus Aerophobetes bacterium]